MVSVMQSECHIPVSILLKKKSGMDPAKILFKSTYLNFSKLRMIKLFPWHKCIFKQEIFIKGILRKLSGVTRLVLFIKIEIACHQLIGKSINSAIEVEPVNLASIYGIKVLKQDHITVSGQ